MGISFKQVQGLLKRELIHGSSKDIVLFKIGIEGRRVEFLK